MTQRVVSYKTLCSSRRAPIVTLDTLLYSHWLGEGGLVSVIFSSCRHRPIRPVIVSPLWGVDYIIYRNKLPFSVQWVPTLRPLFFCRSCRVKMGPTPSCPSSLQEGYITNGNVSIHLLRSPPLPVVHHCRCGVSSIIVGRVFWFWAQTISFLCWSVLALLYGTVELLTENSWLGKPIDTPGRTNYDLL